MIATKAQRSQRNTWVYSDYFPFDLKLVLFSICKKVLCVLCDSVAKYFKSSYQKAAKFRVIQLKCQAAFPSRGKTK